MLETKVFPHEIWKIFKNTFLCRTPIVATSSYKLRYDPFAFINPYQTNVTLIKNHWFLCDLTFVIWQKWKNTIQRWDHLQFFPKIFFLLAIIYSMMIYIQWCCHIKALIFIGITVVLERFSSNSIAISSSNWDLFGVSSTCNILFIVLEEHTIYIVVRK